MYCPYCGEEYSVVKETRIIDTKKTRRRRRECLHCGKLFTTYEYTKEQLQKMTGGKTDDLE